MTQASAQRAAPLRAVPAAPIDTLHSQGFYTKMLLFGLLHIPLVFAMDASRWVGTLHALITIGAGLYFLRDETPHRMIYVTAYITGIEIVWRSTNIYAFYEIAKYSISLLLILSLVKHKVLQKVDILPLFSFLVLMPSIPQTRSPYASLAGLSIFEYPFYFLGIDRELIAFHLSGPFLMALAASYFTGVRFNRQQAVKLLFAFLIPVLALLAIAIREDIRHADQLSSIHVSSWLTSAGFGPNQVSSALGLGVMACFLLLILVKQNNVRLVVGLLMFVLAAQNILTLSRGGVWTALAGIVAAIFFVLRDPRQRMGMIGLVIVLLVGLQFIVMPVLTSIASDAVVARFRNFEPEGRDTIAMEEYRMFLENPVFGGGPGSTKPRLGNTAHTEYSRALGEHGIFGIISVAILLLLTVRRITSNNPPLSKAIMLAFTAWTLMYMVHAATRLAAPSLVFGLGAATYMLGSSTSSSDAEPDPEVPTD